MTPSVVLHFHPGWPFQDRTVLQAIAAAGVYRSQFETGTSNGGPTAYPGGDRWRWESTLFDRKYDDADPQERPVYGAWNRRSDPYGASPRFGSAYLRLRGEVTERATFCWPDSVFEPASVGGPEMLDDLCRLADAAAAGGTPPQSAAPDLPFDDPLNDYVEAHVHGGLLLARDVEAVVVDPSDHEAWSHVLAHLPCPVEAHPGYHVAADQIDPDYRGPDPVLLAHELGGVITPARLAAAARSGEHAPQSIKWLWHCLARFGRPW
ncbi:DUF3626 domain-containing protein [Actinomycetota bacterium]|nr:DUF3626 domain-containing protein [Micrococcales bacterium]